MDETDGPGRLPPAEEIESVFRVYETRRDDDRFLYVGRPLVAPDRLEERLWPVFRRRGYNVSLTTRYPAGDSGLPTVGEYVLVAEPRSVGVDGFPWKNVLFFALTILSTLYAGTLWYGIDLGSDPLALARAWPFALAILGVLCTHEAGHYVMSRYHGVNASLPYFIPLPLTHIGTMGAFIRMRERIPTRRALFDIGAAGPLAGLVATVVVTVVGLHLDPVTYSTATVSDPNTAYIRFNDPLLLHLLADLTGQPLSYADPRKVVNPVVFAGWVGCFVTLFNLLPAGQLDGGHVLRALLGERQETVAAAVPALLFGFAGYLYAFRAVGTAAVIWVVWGVITMVLAYLGPATPIRDRPLNPGRKVLAVVTFLLGTLCFMPVPFQVIS